MAFRIFVATTAVQTLSRPYALTNFRLVCKAGEAYAGSDFVMAYNPFDADAVLFIDGNDAFGADVLRSPIYREFQEKSFVFSALDNSVPFMPGIYTDLRGPVEGDAPYFGGFYIKCIDNGHLATRILPRGIGKYLYSFIGNVSNCVRVRSQILKLKHDRSLVIDRSSGMRDDDLDFIATLRDSSFVLCPPGLGPTSWRVYEAMMAGRVPVIISDRWVPARGVNWTRFAIQVPERELALIPEMLSASENDALEKGRLAREEWERCFSLEGCFGWLGERIQELLVATKNREGRSARDRLMALKAAGAIGEHVHYQFRKIARGIKGGVRR